MLKLIQIADPSINQIFINKDKQITFGSTQWDIELTFSALSSGTKRYLDIMYFILSHKNKSAIIFIDELALYLHRELALTVIKAMNMIVKEKKNISFIFSTHNPMILGNYISYKQTIEINYDHENLEHKATRLSTLFKSHESIENKYKKGIISKFPASSYSFDYLYDIIRRKELNEK